MQYTFVNIFLFQHLFLHIFFSLIFLSYNFSYIFLSIFYYLLLIFFHYWRISSYFPKSCWHLNFNLFHSLLVVRRTNIANYFKKKKKSFSAFLQVRSVHEHLWNHLSLKNLQCVFWSYSQEFGGTKFHVSFQDVTSACSLILQIKLILLD